MDVAVIFDGCTSVDEVFLVAIRFVHAGVIQQRIIAVKLLSKHQKAVDLQRDMYVILSHEYGLLPRNILAFCHDR